jgi:hypothetical protein
MKKICVVLRLSFWIGSFSKMCYVVIFMLFYVFFRAWGKGKGGEGEGDGYVVHCMQVGRGGERFCYTIKICYVVNFLLFLLFFCAHRGKGKGEREMGIFCYVFACVGER